ncbi:PREDICTED: nudC domain-containing protein 2, partial [Cariama cristata]
DDRKNEEVRAGLHSPCVASWAVSERVASVAAEGRGNQLKSGFTFTPVTNSSSHRTVCTLRHSCALPLAETLAFSCCLLQGKLFDSTVTDEGTWTLEDRKLIRIVLMKTNRDAGNCWTSLLENEYAADPWVQDQMQRKLTLERFQRENPGFDFSGAEISGNYSKGGPDFSSLEK